MLRERILPTEEAFGLGQFSVQLSIDYLFRLWTIGLLILTETCYHALKLLIRIEVQS